MSITVNVTVNTAQPERVVERVVDRQHNKVDALVSKLSHDVLNKAEVFFIKGRNLSAKAVKDLLLEKLPETAVKVMKVLPGVLAIALSAI